LSKTGRRRAGPEEYERRLAEVAELLVARALPAQVVRFAVERFGVGTRAAQKYVAEAHRRLRAGASVDPQTQFGMALAGYELIFRRQLKGGDLKGARATLDRLVRLLGLAAPVRGIITIEQIDEEIARLEGEIEGFEEREP
jgi:hypothetical protein